MENKEDVMNEAEKIEILLTSFGIFDRFISSIPTTGKNITKRSLKLAFQKDIRDKLKVTESYSVNMDRIIEDFDKRGY